MKSVVSIVGARPQFIKCAAISRALKGKYNHHIIHTGQHYSLAMSDSLFEELDIPEPNINLKIGSGNPGWQIGSMMISLEEYLIKQQADIVLVYGDTNSTAAAAIVCVKHRIKIGHVEAGMREFDKYIPEESNKLVTDILSDLHFCPTPTAVDNLKKSGITTGVYHVGDVMIDLIQSELPRIESNHALLKSLGVNEKSYYLLTCHRAANTDDPNNLEEILSAASSLDLPVVFPIHPRTQKCIRQFDLIDYLSGTNIISIDPIGFYDTQTLIRHSKKVLTDSGGITKEAYFHRVPGVLIDRQTEWVETVEEGWNIQAGPEKDKIIEAVHAKEIPKQHNNSVGTGNSASQIITILDQFLN